MRKVRRAPKIRKEPKRPLKSHELCSTFIFSNALRFCANTKQNEVRLSHCLTPPYPFEPPTDAKSYGVMWTITDKAFPIYDGGGAAPPAGFIRSGRPKRSEGLIAHHKWKISGTVVCLFVCTQILAKIVGVVRHPLM